MNCPSALPECLISSPFSSLVVGKAQPRPWVSHKRDIVLPGATLRPRRGPPPLDSDRPFISGLRIASSARAFLENMRPSRARSGVARTLPAREIEERLDEMLRRTGESALRKLRDDAREISEPLDLRDEYRRLDNLIGTLLSTRNAALESPSAIARAAGANALNDP